MFKYFVFILAFASVIPLQFAETFDEQVADKDVDIFGGFPLHNKEEEGCPELTCSDGECYPAVERCDGSVFCFDSSDEEGCSNICTMDEFRCPSDGTCLPRTAVCDRTRDCEDGSDEADCYFKTTCDDGEFLCENGKCISEHLHCDGINHCNDFSDEKNCSKTECSIKHFDCYNNGRKCLDLMRLCDGRMDCEHGEDEHGCGDLTKQDVHVGSNQDDSKSGVCETSPCHHDCTERAGLQICSCNKGYSLADDGRACQTHNSEEPLLWLGNGTKLIGYGIYSKDVLDQYNLGEKFSAFTVGFEENLFFWVNNQMNTISMGLMDSSKSFEKSEVLIRPPNAHTISSLAYDWTNGNLYFADAGKHVKMANEDEIIEEIGSKISVVSTEKGPNGEFFHASILASPQVNHPNAIVLDPRSGHRHLYWTQIGKEAGLFKSNMDGTDVLPLAETYVKHPVSLAIDFSYNWLLWVDGESDHLYMTHLSGSTHSIMVFDHHKSPVAITAFEGSIFWGGNHDFNEMKVWMSNHEGDALPRLATVKSRSLAIHHAYAQPDDEQNPCKDRPCDHICLPSDSGHVCRCHDNEVQRSRSTTYELGSDGKTCNVKKDQDDGEVEVTEPNADHTSEHDPTTAKILATILTTRYSTPSSGDGNHSLIAGGERVGHEAQHSKDGESKDPVEANSGSSKNQGLNIGMIWLYFTVSSLSASLLALIGVGVYKLKASRDSRKVNFMESTPLQPQVVPKFTSKDDSSLHV